MQDSFNRRISYLRISVTDLCNLRCRYCRPAEGVPLLSHEDILSYEEIAEFANQAVSMGINKVRLTGGEPLVRKGIVTLVEMLRNISGIEDLSMTTNGVLLSQFASQLKMAGIERINISLDTLSPEKYRNLTRGGDIADVLQGIQAAKSVGMFPIKLNCVVEKSKYETDAQDVARYADENGFQVRYIKKMDLAVGAFGVVEEGGGGDCLRCNRLRLSADGFLRPCLFSDLCYNIREIGSKEAIYHAIEKKPESGTVCFERQMSQIGG